MGRLAVTCFHRDSVYIAPLGPLKFRSGIPGPVLSMKPWRAHSHSHPPKCFKSSSDPWSHSGSSRWPSLFLLGDRLDLAPQGSELLFVNEMGQVWFLLVAPEENLFLDFSSFKSLLGLLEFSGL